MKNLTTVPEPKEAETVPNTALLETLPLDVKKYQSHMEEFDLTEEQKAELLETLWSIMAAFVDLGFGTDAVQYLFRDNGPNSLNSEEDEVEDKKPSSRFNHVALKAEEKEDRS